MRYYILFGRSGKDCPGSSTIWPIYEIWFHPEIAAFEKYLPSDIHIINCDSLHGPGFDPNGQRLIVIPHRTTKAAYQRMTDVLASLGSEMVEIPD